LYSSFVFGYFSTVENNLIIIPYSLMSFLFFPCFRLIIPHVLVVFANGPQGVVPMEYFFSKAEGGEGVNLYLSLLDVSEIISINPKEYWLSNHLFFFVQCYTYPIYQKSLVCYFLQNKFFRNKLGE
jgi:hypothetical protein